MDNFNIYDAPIDTPIKMNVFLNDCENSVKNIRFELVY